MQQPNLKEQANETEFAGTLKQIFTLLGVSTAQSNNISTSLDKAVALNFSRRLLDRLPPEKRDEFEDRYVNHPQGLFEYCEKNLSQEEIKGCLREATDEILRKFLDSI